MNMKRLVSLILLSLAVGAGSVLSAYADTAPLNIERAQEDLAFARPAPRLDLYHVSFAMRDLWPEGGADEVVVQSAKSASTRSAS